MNTTLFLIAFLSLSVTGAETSDGDILLWNDLKKQLQRLEKNREADLKRIQRLEQENKQFRMDLHQLRTMMKEDGKSRPRNESVAKSEERGRRSTRPERSAAKSNSEEKSVEFLSETALQDDGILTDVEILKNEKYSPPERVIVELDEQKKKIDWLISLINRFSEKLSVIEEYGVNCTGVNGKTTQPVPVDVIYSSTDLDKIKELVHHTGLSIAQIQTNQYEIKDQQRWVVFQIKQINDELESIDEDREKIWSELRKVSNVHHPESKTVSLDENHIDEFSGEEDSSGWKSATFVDKNDDIADGSARFKHVERTATDAFSMVTQMRTKLDLIEKDISNSLSLFEKLEKSQLSRSELNIFTQTVDFVQETLANLTRRLTENEVASEKKNSKIENQFDDFNKRLRFLSLQTEKVKHLANVVKDHQMDHFSAIQQFRHDMNALETNVLKLGMKLTNFQADVLNATLTSYKNDNRDLHQDVQIADLYSKFDKVDGKFPEIHQTMKEILTSIRSKAERGELKNLGAEMQKTAEKLQLISALNDSLNSVSESVRLLETQLPTDCSVPMSYCTTSVRATNYIIKPKGSPKAVQVYCETELSSPENDAIGWTVIQKRVTGRENFNRTYDQYRYGFGDPKGDYWLGNEYIHMLTRQKDNIIRIDTWDIYGDYYFAEYGLFKVASFEEGFRLDIGNYSGNLTDALQHHNRMRFSTFDLDADSSSTHCARYYASGWWFSNCQKANLNGLYPVGVIWFSSNANNWIQLEKTIVKIRPVK